MNTAVAWVKRLSPANGSLTRRTLWRVALRIAAVVAIATIVSFWHVRNGLEDQALDQLDQYVEQRSARESEVFDLAVDNLRIFTQAYERALRDVDGSEAHNWFTTMFERQDDGTLRLGASFFTGEGITGFIGKHVMIDDDLRKRLFVAFNMLKQFGPAWRSRFVNLYAVTPESALLMYWPDEAWTLDAHDWEIYAKLALAAGQREGDVVVMHRFAAGIAGAQRWSDLYYDYAARDWMVSGIEPVNRDSLHLLSVGQDILLQDLIGRTLLNELPGTYNILFRADGRLVAHPRYMEAIQARGGTLAIQDAGDPNLQRIFEATLGRAEGQRIVENGDDDELLAITHLAAPGWFLVTVFPRSIISSRAFETAQLILILGAAALLVEIMVLFFILRRQVAGPLRALVGATRDIATGRFDAKVPVERDDEIGELARSVKTMAAEIDARQAAINERSAALAEVNEQLADELKERERAERELARQREVLHQSEKLNALGSLLAGVAHELNNPLSVVVGRSMMLEDRFRDEPEAVGIAKLRGAAERCAKIVKTFLALARQETPSREPANVEELIRSALDIVGYGLRTNSIAVTVEADDELPEIMVDPNQIIQVFTNLLVNAQHALSEQAGARTISIGARLLDAEHVVRIAVTDNGPGIPPELRSRIFEPFFTTKEVGEGTGLGLSVSRGLIEAHGGTIIVEQPAEGGTCFIITLPVRATPAPEDAAAVDDEAGIPARRILIVEDEPDVAQMLAEVLEGVGHKTEIAATGKEALARLDAEPFDLILSDMRMPDMDGRGLFETIHARNPVLAARVIFVTGDALSGPTARFLEEVDQPVIEKPFAPAEVRRVVARVLSEEPQT